MVCRKAAFYYDGILAMVSSGIMIFLAVQGISDDTCSQLILNKVLMNKSLGYIMLNYFPMIYLASGIAQLFLGLLMILFPCCMIGMSAKANEMVAKNDDVAKLVDNDDLEQEAKRQPTTLAKVVILDEKA